jgi:hypothetical protein
MCFGSDGMIGPRSPWLDHQDSGGGAGRAAPDGDRQGRHLHVPRHPPQTAAAAPRPLPRLPTATGTEGRFSPPTSLRGRPHPLPRATDSAYCALALIPWVTGAAAIHWAGHGDPARAVLSVALHAGLPIAGWYLGRAPVPRLLRRGEPHPRAGRPDGYRARDRAGRGVLVESIPRAPAGSRPPGPTLTPTIDTSGGGLGLGLAGSF